jgi:hypothetical protein
MIQMMIWTHQNFKEVENDKVRAFCIYFHLIFGKIS